MSELVTVSVKLMPRPEIDILEVKYTSKVISGDAYMMKIEICSADKSSQQQKYVFAKNISLLKTKTECCINFKENDCFIQKT